MHMKIIQFYSIALKIVLDQNIIKNFFSQNMLNASRVEKGKSREQRRGRVNRDRPLIYVLDFAAPPGGNLAHAIKEQTYYYIMLHASCCNLFAALTSFYFTENAQQLLLLPLLLLFPWFTCSFPTGNKFIFMLHCNLQLFPPCYISHGFSWNFPCSILTCMSMFN